MIRFADDSVIFSFKTFKEDEIVRLIELAKRDPELKTVEDVILKALKYLTDNYVEKKASNSLVCPGHRYNFKNGIEQCIHKKQCKLYVPKFYEKHFEPNEILFFRFKRDFIKCNKFR